MKQITEIKRRGNKKKYRQKNKEEILHSTT